ncbi:MAG: crotonase/enoyl-CoA hydratase family protein [Alphaproteobacteria bacterium]|nr:crotonase/enoyl-CoA hydratase family protein [Alphaproteobacteria bacterium]
MPKILVERNGSVTTIIMNRPEVRNALDNEAIGLLGEVFQSFDRDDEARVAVLTGEGGAFCAGADLKEMAQGANYQAWAGSEGGALRTPLSKPVIAAVEGHACAGGLGVALYCDLRVADETAVFGVFSRRWGVPMSDGTTVRLPRLVGMSNALDMLLTGRAIGADEAKQMGLANYVVPKGAARAEAEALALKVSEYPQIAMRSDRESAYTQLGLTLDDAVLEETRLAEAAKRQEAQSGAARFAAGAGRHGSFE